MITDNELRNLFLQYIELNELTLVVEMHPYNVDLRNVIISDGYRFANLTISLEELIRYSNTDELILSFSWKLIVSFTRRKYLK